MARIVLLPGDGIGPEVTAQARLVLESVAEAAGDLALEFQELPFGGAAIEACGSPLPPEVLEACRRAHQAALTAGAERVITTLMLDERTDREHQPERMVREVVDGLPRPR